mgnify:CR=1 FL=1
MSSAAQHLHVPLDSALYQALMAEARRLGRPATQVAREAIERLLEARRREAIDRELLDYARAVAGTSADLDPIIEAAGVERLLGRRPRKGGKQ